MNKRFYLFVTGLLLLMTAAKAPMAQQDVLMVRSINAVREVNGLPVITGIAVNQSPKAIKNAFIRFNLYDAENILVGNTIAHASNIGPGEQWRFRATATVKEFVVVKVSDIQIFDN